MDRTVPTALTSSSQLLIRNLGAWEDESILVVDSPGGEIGPVLAERFPKASLTLLQTNYADYRTARGRLQRFPPACVAVHFSAWCPVPGGTHDLAIVYRPKGRSVWEMVLAMVSSALTPGGRLLLVGPVRGGIKSAAKTLQQHSPKVDKLDAARRGALYVAERPVGVSPGAGLDNWLIRWPCQVAGHALEVVSLPGVFSHGRLDDGTRLLLEALSAMPVPPAPAVLDFGSGCGVIGAWLGVHWPGVEVEMVDAGAWALEAARRTATINEVSAAVYATDIWSDVRGTYGLIVSNPPFHSGVETDYHVVEAFLRGAAQRLHPDGKLVFVANRFLRYQPLLEAGFSHSRIVADDGRYRVYEARPSRSARSRR